MSLAAATGALLLAVVAPAAVGAPAAAGVVTAGAATVDAVATAAVAPPAYNSDNDSWREPLQAAIEASRARSYQGRLVVVSFSGEPTIAEVAVTQDEDGRLVTAQAESWMLGHLHGQSFFGDEDTGRLLRLGAVDRRSFSLTRLARKYEVRVEGHEPAIDGSATVVAVRERGSDVVRERLYIDDSSHLVVRRETYRGDGRPLRLTAFTALELAPVELPALSPHLTEVEAAHTDVTSRGVRILRNVGWVVPDRLDDGFDLLDASALGEEEESSLHLLYSDGLYRLSVYEQRGRVDGAALAADGAEPVKLGRLHAYRWPGAEPVTYVWTGAGLTFTAVSDAPPDALADALVRLPHEAPPSLAGRLQRGFRRVVGWAWPFD